MEFITGDTLAAILKKVGRLEVQLAIDLSRQIALGLNAVHDEGLIHRDIKPANVMLDSRGRAKLTDFGLAASADEVTGAESRSGTPAYQAPEQLAGESVTRLSDIYAYGLLVYELLTGQRPFIATSTSKLLELQLTTTPPLPSTFSPTVPPEVDQVVMRCLAPNPHDRPRSAHETWRFWRVHFIAIWIAHGNRSLVHTLLRLSVFDHFGTNDLVHMGNRITFGNFYCSGDLRLLWRDWKMLPIRQAIAMMA